MNIKLLSVSFFKIIFLLGIILTQFACLKSDIGPEIEYGTIEVEGTVLGRQTGDPIKGLTVSLVKRGGNNWGNLTHGGDFSYVLSVITDENGKYSFTNDASTEDSFSVELNSGPDFAYNDEYGEDSYKVSIKESYNETTYLNNFTELSVEAVTSNPLGENDEIRIAVPSRGCKCDDIFTSYAIAESYNEVSWRVIRNGVTESFVDSVFCYNGVLNEFTINY